MAKQTWIKNGGTWRKVKSVWLKINGVWKKDVLPKGIVQGNWKSFMQYILPDLDFNTMNTTMVLRNTSVGITNYYTIEKGDLGHLVLFRDSGGVNNNRRITINNDGRITLNVLSTTLINGSYSGDFIYGTEVGYNVAKASDAGDIVLSKSISSSIRKVIWGRGVVIATMQNSSTFSLMELNKDDLSVIRPAFNATNVYAYRLEYDRVNDVYYEFKKQFTTGSAKIYCKSDYDTVIWEATLPSDVDINSAYVFFDYKNKGVIVGHGDNVTSGSNPSTTYIDRNGKILSFVGGSAGAVDKDVLWTIDSRGSNTVLRLYNLSTGQLVKSYSYTRADASTRFGGLPFLPITSKWYMNFLVWNRYSASDFTNSLLARAIMRR